MFKQGYVYINLRNFRIRSIFFNKLDIAELNGMEATTYIDITQGLGVPNSILTFLCLIALGGTYVFSFRAIV